MPCAIQAWTVSICFVDTKLVASIFSDIPKDDNYGYEDDFVNSRCIVC